MKAYYEPIEPLASNSFKAAFQSKKEFDYPWHYHPEYELTYILSSQGVRYVGNSMENFTQDDLILLGPHLPHCWKNTGEQQKPASAIVVQWKDDFLGKGWMNIREFEAIRDLLVLSNKGLKFHPSVAVKIREKLYRLLELPSFEKLLLLLQIFQELAQTCKFRVLCGQGFIYHLDKSNSERINAVYQYVKTHYLEKITLEDVAARVNMNEEYFSRFFSKVMQKSFFTFLNEYRVNAACKLLIETDRQVAEVCYASGYESIPFFYRQFKKFKNCSPLTYRLNYQKTDPAKEIEK
jgi:AraC-like DNA-binding protein